MLRNHIDNISRAIKSNTDLNACGIIDSYNVPNEKTQEPADDKLTYSPFKKGYTGGIITELNSYGIRVSSDIPTYNMQHPIHIDTYIILVAK